MTVEEYMEYVSLLEYHAQAAVEYAIEDLEQGARKRSKSRTDRMCDMVRGGSQNVEELRYEVSEIAVCALILLAEIDRLLLAETDMSA